MHNEWISAEVHSFFYFIMPLFLNEKSECIFYGGYFIQNNTFPFNNQNEGHSEQLKGIINHSYDFSYTLK